MAYVRHPIFVSEWLYLVHPCYVHQQSKHENPGLSNDCPHAPNSFLCGSFQHLGLMHRACPALHLSKCTNDSVKLSPPTISLNSSSYLFRDDALSQNLLVLSLGAQHSLVMNFYNPKKKKSSN